MTETINASPSQDANVPWYREMNAYHWIVFIICSLAWAFDCMDQHLFTYARAAAVGDLMLLNPTSDQALRYATIATSIMMLGWATGGIIFGIIGDKFGRAKTMFYTILIYSVLTGLSAFSVSIWDFMALRFLAGVGIGGQFAIGASLLAESMPGRARPYVLGIMQVISGIGNIGAALVAMSFTELDSVKMLPMPAWRCLFLFGSVPAILVYFVAKYLREPETWKSSVANDREKRGSLKELFTEPTIRKHVILGMILAATGVIGAWGVGLFSMELASKVFVKIAEETPQYKQIVQNILDKHGMQTGPEMAMTDEIKTEIEEATRDLRVTVSGRWRAVNLLIYNIGAMTGMYGFTLGAVYWGRRMTFTVFMLGCIVFTSATFLYMNSAWTLVTLVPLMSFFLMSMFGGYTIYFPELFPTRLRSTGVSFCYNAGRYIAACGPLALAGLTDLFSGFATQEDATLPFRYAGVAMCGVFVIGIVTVWFLPETKGKPLPD